MLRFAVAAFLALGLSCRSRGPAPGDSPQATSGDAERDEREIFAEMFARSYVPGRSGQIFVVPERGDVLLSRPDDLYRFMHGSPWDYDVDIPLLLYGPSFIRPGSYAENATQQDVAPTLATLLGLPVPTTMTGHPLSSAIADSKERPSVVFLAVLDGMRRDYFDTYAERLPTLTRLRKEGAWFANARVNYLPSVTSAGHATIATGTDPRFHGIHANALYDRRTGESRGPFPNLSPGDYLAFTLPDFWNLATGGKAVILVQGTTPRAAISLAGWGGCAVNGSKFVMAMFDARRPAWVTNPDCYRLPEYLADDDATEVWEKAGKIWMGHTVDSGSTLVRTALFARFQGDALVEMIQKEPIGQDGVPDLLAINFKTPDYVSHEYGPGSPEIAAALEELDANLGRVVAALEQRAGAGHYVVAVTADHGMPPEPDGGSHARRYVEDIVDSIHDRFDPDGRKLVLDFSDSANCQIYVDLDRLEALHLTLRQVADFLAAMPFIHMAFTEDDIRPVRLSR